MWPTSFSCRRRRVRGDDASTDREVLSVARGASRQQRSPTPEQIKIAHRKTGLKHHPDKEVSSSTPQETSSIFTNLNTADDAFFKCIQKAHDVLTNPEKRRQFDSVDPTVLDAEEDDPKERAFAKKGRKLDDNAFFDTLGIHQMWRGSPCADSGYSGNVGTSRLAGEPMTPTPLFHLLMSTQ